jgi:hypothetical protein
MANSVILSGVLHVTVILIVIVALPWWFEPTETIQAVPVQVISAYQLAQLQKGQPRSAQENSAPPREAAIPKAPELPEDVAIPRAEIEKQAVSTPPEPPVVAPEQSVADARQKPIAPEKPKPSEKETDKKQDRAKEEPAERDFASALINKLKEKKKSSRDSQATQAQQAALPPDDFAEPPLTEGEKDIIRQQIEQNWLVDVGMPGLGDIIVEIVVQMNPDGTVQSAKIDEGGFNGNPNWRIVAESARRAVLKSSPLRMPPEKPYQAWARMRLVFSAREMLGL